MNAINDFLLSLFTSSDEVRKHMMFPNLENGIVSASDGHVLIQIPQSELCLKYNTHPKYPNVDRVLESYNKGEYTKKVRVKVSDVLKELTEARIEIDKNSIKCEECNGQGEVTCDYCNHPHECEKCDGEGYTYTEKNFARIKFNMIEDEINGSLCGIDIDELYFHPFQLYRLAMVAICKNIEEFDIYYKDINGSTVALFGNIKVLIMTMIKYA